METTAAQEIMQIAGVELVPVQTAREMGRRKPADMEKVRTVIPQTAFANAGQVCISTQRVIAPAPIYDELIDVLVPAVAEFATGDPLDPTTKVGPMIREADAVRVGEWIDEAVAGGAELLAGGDRSGQLFEPTLLGNVSPDMRVSCDELFGPAMGVTRVQSADEAIQLANDSIYGLSAAIFTQDIDVALRFAREVDSGNVHINWGSQWRTDLMPYGGLKDSGMGKEGPRYAVEEMTEHKMVVIH